MQSIQAVVGVIALQQWLTLASSPTNMRVEVTAEAGESTEAVQSPGMTNLRNPPFWREFLVFVTSWVAHSARFSSTVFFRGVKELSIDFNTSVASINLVNSGVLLTLGVSTLI